MTTVRICERWNMEVPDPVPGDPWFLDWALRSPRQAGIHLTAGLLAYQSIQHLPIQSAREYFGGMGAQALMIESMFCPSRHTVLDYSASAVQHLKPMIDGAEQADSYNPRNTEPADLVGLDFGDLTVWKTRPGNPQADLLDRVFLLEPRAVVLTDVAGPYLHLHRERYETMLKDCSTYPWYLDSFADFIEERWGYSLVAGFWHRWSTVMSLVPTGSESRGQFIPTPAEPVGLEIL